MMINAHTWLKHHYMYDDNPHICDENPHICYDNHNECDDNHGKSNSSVNFLDATSHWNPSFLDPFQKIATLPIRLCVHVCVCM